MITAFLPSQLANVLQELVSASASEQMYEWSTVWIPLAGIHPHDPPPPPTPPHPHLPSRGRKSVLKQTPGIPHPEEDRSRTSLLVGQSVRVCVWLCSTVDEEVWKCQGREDCEFTSSLLFIFSFPFSSNVTRVHSFNNTHKYQVF